MAVAEWNREWMCKAPHPKAGATKNVAKGVSPKSKIVKAPSHEPKMCFHSAAMAAEKDMD